MGGGQEGGRDSSAVPALNYIDFPNVEKLYSLTTSSSPDNFTFRFLVGGACVSKDQL